MFNKGAVIEMLLSEYDEQIKELMRSKLAILSKDEFSKMIKQIGLYEFSNGYYTFISKS